MKTKNIFKRKEKTPIQKCMYFLMLYRKGIIDWETYNNKVDEIKAEEQRMKTEKSIICD